MRPTNSEEVLSVGEQVGKGQASKPGAEFDPSDYEIEEGGPHVLGPQHRRTRPVVAS